MDTTQDLTDRDLETAVERQLGRTHPAARDRDTFESGRHEGFGEGCVVCADKLDAYITEHLGGSIDWSIAPGLRGVVEAMRKAVLA